MITERHNVACSMIFKAISKTGSLGSCFVCMDVGSSERLAMCHQPETQAVGHPCNPCNPCLAM